MNKRRIVTFVIGAPLLIILAAYIAGKYCEIVDNYDDFLLPDDLRNTKKQLDLFKFDCKRYPTNSEGLRVLIKDNRPKDCIKYNPKGYIDEIPTNIVTKDPFEYSNKDGTIEVSTSLQIGGKKTRYRLINDEYKIEK